jgi:mono/diheme cytochrome c family protein
MHGVGTGTARRAAMAKQVAALIGVLALATVAVSAQVRRGPIQRSPANDGKAMFDQYCTPCHGRDAKGDGPVAKALTKAPADLTQISARNGGTFPAVRVQRFISGEEVVAAHGTRDMPIWGDLFRSLGDGLGELRTNNLTNYLKSIQTK